jgi:hypothetical protein
MLRDLFFNNFWKILFIYVFVVIENIGFAIQPTFLGYAINSMIYGKEFNLIYYSIFVFILVIISIFRRMIDTRIYIEMWKKACISIINKMRNKNLTPDKIFSRYTLINYHINIFEVILPQIAQIVITIISSLIMILVIDYNFFIILMVMIIIPMINYVRVGIKTKKIDIEVQEAIEETQKGIAIDGGEIEPIKKRAVIFIKRSDLEATAYGLNELCWIFCSIIYVTLVTKTEMLAGEIMATLLYIDKIFTSTAILSNIISNFSSVLAADHIIDKD